MNHADASQQPDGQADMSHGSFSAELEPKGNLTHLELQDPRRSRSLTSEEGPVKRQHLHQGS